MHRPNCRPSAYRSKSDDLHFDNVPKLGLSFAGRLDLETVGAVKTDRFREVESNFSPRLVRFDGIAYRTMSADSANAQGTVEAHRHPAVDGPKFVIGRTEAIDQLSNLIDSAVQNSFVNVENLHEIS